MKIGQNWPAESHDRHFVMGVGLGGAGGGGGGALYPSLVSVLDLQQGTTMHGHVVVQAELLWAQVQVVP